jgi:hypothetical protein
MAILKYRAGLGYQFAALKQSAIAPGKGKLNASYFYWECDIQPTELGRTYKVLIFYGGDYVPRAFVLSPNLQKLAEGKEIPHLYSQEKGYLCLYHPGSGEWNASMSVANDFVPWIYMWLMFFEQWLVLDKWHGGGIHPIRSNNVIKSTMTKKPSKKKTYPVHPMKKKAYKVYENRLKVHNKILLEMGEEG